MDKKVLYVIGGLLLILILTNPTMNTFKEKIGIPDKVATVSRTNYFLFSTYKETVSINGTTSNLNYFGFLTIFLIYSHG
jgi:hypothetical protein